MGLVDQNPGRLTDDGEPLLLRKATWSKPSMLTYAEFGRRPLASMGLLSRDLKEWDDNTRVL